VRPVPLSFAVILDMDGVLVDSEPLQIRAYVQAASDFGVRLTPAELVQRVTVEGMLVRTLFELRGGDPADYDGLFRPCYPVMSNNSSAPPGRDAGRFIDGMMDCGGAPVVSPVVLFHPGYPSQQDRRRATGIGCCAHRESG